MPSYITTTIDEAPRVLVFHQRSELAQELSPHLTNQGVLVELCDLTTVTPSQLQTLLARYQEIPWYHCFLCHDDASKLVLHSQALTSFFATQSATTLLMGVWQIPQSDSGWLNAWRELAEHSWQAVQNWQQAIPHARVWGAENMILRAPRENVCFSWWYDETRSTVIVPDGWLGFGTPRAVLEKVAPLIFRHHAPKYLTLRAEALSWQEWLKQVYTHVQLSMGKNLLLEQVQELCTLGDGLGDFAVQGYSLRPDDQTVVLESWARYIVTHAAAVLNTARTLPEHVVRAQAPQTSAAPPALVPPQASAVNHHVLSPTRSALPQQQVFSRSAQLPPVSGGYERSARPQVVPLRPPRITNRMHAYQQRVRQEQRGRQLESFLPSVGKPRAMMNPLTPPLSSVTPQAERVVEEQLHQLFGAERQVQKRSRVQEKLHSVKVSQRRTGRQLVATRFGMAVGVGILLGVGIMGSFWGSTELLSAQLVGITKHDPAKLTLQSTALLAKVVGWQATAYQRILGNESLQVSAKLSDAGRDAVAYAFSQREAQAASDSLYDYFLNKTQKNSDQSSQLKILVNNLSEHIQQSYQNLSYLQLDAQALSKLDEDQAGATALTAYVDGLQESRRSLIAWQQLEPIFGTILAEEGRKSYLIVLQNAEELRPTGGLVQSVALITIERGAILDFQVVSAANLDSTLAGEISPPPELAKYIGQTRWYLRDANWSPHYPEAARQIQWFFEKSSGRKVDGVLALNTETLPDLLAVLGPVQLTEYPDEVITERNVLEKIEYHSELKVTTGPKDDYLTKVFSQVVSRVFSNSAKLSQSARVLGKALRNNQAFFSTNDPAVNQVLANLGWSGEVLFPQCPTQFSAQDCFVDGIMQVEANVGVNRANHFIKRTTSHEISLSPTEVQHHRTVTWQNTSTSNGWPAGTYKVFTRFYLPEDAELKEVRLDGQLVPTSQLILKQELQRSVVGVFAEVPIQKNTKLEVLYQQKVTLQAPVAYTFFDQRQAGIAPEPLDVTLHLDPKFRPTIIAPHAVVSGQTITFQSDRTKHTFVGVRLQ